MKIIAAVYSHPEFYPPTLNALKELSFGTESIWVLSRYMKEANWNYPSNVHSVMSGEKTHIRASETKSIIWKLQSFFRFTWCMKKLLNEDEADWVILYDPIPLLAYRVASFGVKKKPKIWYHNHDVLENHRIRRLSVAWLAQINERHFFHQIELFTLPSNERKIYFSMEKFTGKYLLLPNYPPLSPEQPHTPRDNNELKDLKIIYQGSISSGHGLEELVSAVGSNHLPQTTLTLIGNVRRAFKDDLIKIQNSSSQGSQIKLLDPVDYQKLKAITAKYHVGWAVHLPINIAFTSAAQASNKIYEYIAAGLPVILYDHPHYRKYLAMYPWAFFTDLSLASLETIMNNIRANYSELSQAAYQSYLEELHFEKHFQPIAKFLQEK